MNHKLFQFLVVFLMIIVLATAKSIFNTNKNEGSLENCESNEDCVENMRCNLNTGVCLCFLPHVFVNNTKCLKPSGYGEHCEVSEQCAMKDNNTICSAGRCVFKPASGYVGEYCVVSAQCAMIDFRTICSAGRCVLKPVEPTFDINQKKNNGMSEEFKMIVCCLGGFVCCILFTSCWCFIKRALSLNSLSTVSEAESTTRRPLQSSNVFEEVATTRRLMRIHNVSEDFTYVRANDQPPNYQDILKQDLKSQDFPPPDYRDIVATTTPMADLSTNTQPMDPVHGSLRTGASATTAFSHAGAHQVLQVPSNATSANSNSGVVTRTRQDGADNHGFDNRKY